MQLRSITFLAAIVFLLSYSAHAQAGAFESYEIRPDQSFQLPGSMVGGLTIMDALPDGRLVAITTRSSDWQPGPAELYVENGAGTRDFRYLGDLPLSTIDSAWYNPGAFVRASQNTTGSVKIAVGGSSYSLGVFDAAELTIPAVAPALGTPAPITVNWFVPSQEVLPSSAAWYDNQTLAVASGFFGSPSNLTLLDTLSSPDAPVQSTIIVGPTSGASGGVTFDTDGNLYYGNGYDYATGGAGDTGQIFRYPLANWQAAIGGPALGFGSGEDVLQMLSANSLNFDVDGNLIVGGGNSFGSDPNMRNFLGLVQFNPDGTIAAIRQFDPDTGSDFNSYSVVYNRATNEIYAFDPFGSDPRQAFVISVPEPASLTLFSIALVGLVQRCRRGRMARG